VQLSGMLCGCVWVQLTGMLCGCVWVQLTGMLCGCVWVQLTGMLCECVWVQLTGILCACVWMQLIGEGKKTSHYAKPLTTLLYFTYSGPGSSVSIATGCGLDGKGIESCYGCNFSHTSRPALGPTQPPVQWVSGLSQG
jgi:hypothetical protein